MAATAVVADTQIFIWYVKNRRRLSPAATTALEAATAADEPIYVSAHSLVELVYAFEKWTDPLSADDRQDILDALVPEDSPLTVVPVDAEIANRVAGVPRAVSLDENGESRVVNADPADRIIVATAEALGIPLVSADRKIPKMTSGRVIW